MKTSAPVIFQKAALFRIAMIAGIGMAVAAAACAFIVSETESALVLRFGRPVRVIETPGLYFRLPAPIEKVVRVDRRLSHAEIRLSETLTRDQRNVIVPLCFTWKVADPLKFHTAVGNSETARLKLDALVTSARNSVLGAHDFGDLLAAEGRASKLPQMEGEMLALCRPDASRQLGIELISTGITQIQLPQANTESVFRRMRAERKRDAEQYRAEGRAKAAEMKAETDREANRLIAEAKRTAEEIRGQAEAEAAMIYADAHGRNPSFYRFLRELQSLRTVVDKNTTVVLDTSIAPFHWLTYQDSDGDPVKKVRLPERGPKAAPLASPSASNSSPAVTDVMP